MLQASLFAYSDMIFLSAILCFVEQCELLMADEQQVNWWVLALLQDAKAEFHSKFQNAHFMALKHLHKSADGN